MILNFIPNGKMKQTFQIKGYANPGHHASSNMTQVYILQVLIKIKWLLSRVCKNLSIMYFFNKYALFSSILQLCFIWLQNARIHDLIYRFFLTMEYILYYFKVTFGFSSISNKLDLFHKFYESWPWSKKNISNMMKLSISN